MAPTPELSPAGQAARSHDPDRFLTALFAPTGCREALFLLIAFNHELVRALEMSSARTEAGPLAALIRLQWWREVVEGQRRRHELAEPLETMLAAGGLDRGMLLAVIEAREAEAGGVETLEQWRQLQLEGPGGVQVAFAHALGVRDLEMLDRLRRLGAAYGAGSIYRHHAALLAAGRRPVPEDLLQPSSRVDADVVAPLRAAGLQWLAQAGRPSLGRSRVAAALAGVLARRDLAGMPGSVPRGLGDRMALAAAWLRGSV